MVEAGHFALVLAFALALIQSTVPLIGARMSDERMMAVGGPVAVTGFALTAVAFAALTMAYVQSDFGRQCQENSHSLKPLLFRSPAPGATTKARCPVGADPHLLRRWSRCSGATCRSLRQRAGRQGWIGAAFLLFILTTSNPFARLDPAR
jgi:cytochrome c-type biogenesis protein CcmF